MSEKSVLIISATAGTGHVRAGEALLKAARADRPHWYAEHIDVLSLAPRWVKAAYGGGFELVAAHAPRLWRGAYSLADGVDADQARWAGIARRVLFRAFERLLSGRSWDHVICTHFLPAQLAAGRISNVPFSVVITDFDLHRYWVQPRVQHYCVATDSLARSLSQRLGNVHVSKTGIPIDAAFSALPSSTAARAELGLDQHRPVVLVMGGGVGIGVSAATRTLLETAPADAQLVVLCGRNSETLQQLSRWQVPTNRMRCFGYRDDMPLLYAAADMVATKPGGLTCSEVLAAGKPLILTRPIPGHEEANVKFLTNAGAALSVDHPLQLGQAVRCLLEDSSRRERMRTAARELAQPDSARLVLKDMETHMLSDAAA